MQTVSQPKSLWSGEIGLIATLAIVGLLCLFIAVKTIEPAYRFHMALGVICAAAAILRDLPALQRARRGAAAARDQRAAEL